MKYQVLLFYKYVTVEDPKHLKWVYEGLCKKYELTGRTIIAEEGINSTLEGTEENTESFLKEFMQDARFADIRVKKSLGNGSTFPKCVVKVRDEIVSTKLPKEVDPRKETGKHLPAEELHAWFEKGEDFVIVDMRNSYEFNSGHFKGSIDPGMKASRDLPNVVEKLRVHQDKNILTVCTGGVRCEKMSAYLLNQGFKNVYQLEDGIHSYMEKYPGKNYSGALYTFDGRVTMDFGGDREIIGRCGSCGKATEEYQNCANDECHTHFLVCSTCADKSVENNQPIFCTEECSINPPRITWRVRKAFA
jgi:UPF0176 protein